MAAGLDKPGHTNDGVRQGRRFSLAVVLDAALSLTFLVLAAYIAIYASNVEGPDSRNLVYFAALMGSYGIWRTLRSYLKNRGQNEQAE
jgi:hypothetical protein